MKKTKYKVMFKHGHEYVYAFSVIEAEILAKAIRINNGLDYEVIGIIEVEKASNW